MDPFIGKILDFLLSSRYVLLSDYYGNRNGKNEALLFYGLFSSIKSAAFIKSTFYQFVIDLGLLGESVPTRLSYNVLQLNKVRPSPAAT